MTTYQNRLKPLILWAFAAVLGANAAFMLIAPLDWYNAVPGVMDTGGFNRHFIRDIGIIYLMIALAFGMTARGAALGLGALAMAALWLAGHGVLHVYDISCGNLPPSHWALDFGGVFVPALAAPLIWLWIAPDYKEGTNV